MARSELYFDPFEQGFIHATSRFALAAGARIMQYFAVGIEPQYKSDKSPFTRADIEAEAILTEGLTALCPQSQIIGEEAASDKPPTQIAPHFFLLDPLDGTREFIKNSKDFTVNIGLIANAEPLFGLIYAPAHGQLYVTAHDGAYELPLAPDAKDIDFSQAVRLTAKPVPPAPRIIASPYRSKATEKLIGALSASAVLATGSSLKFCEIAAARADIYPRHGVTMEWDTAAGHAILAAAGGAVRCLDGSALEYGKAEAGLKNPGFIASGKSFFR